MRQIRQLRRQKQHHRQLNPADNRKVGARAEQAAADLYRSRGFSLLARNLRLGHLEVDLLARHGPLLVLVEVRARNPRALRGPFASIQGPKLRRLRAATQIVWRRYQHDPSIQRVRVDVAAVNLWVTPVEITIAEAIL